MFKNILYLLSATALLASCEKTTLDLPVTQVTSGARIKLTHAAPDLPGVNLLVGGQKVSGFTPSGATSTNPGIPVPVNYGTTFPGATAGYAVVTPGQVPVIISAPAATTAGSATIVSEQTLTLEDNKYYSLLLAGTGTRPEVLLLTDDLSQTLDPTKYYVRFINLAIGQNYDLSLSNGTVLAPNVALKAVSPFIPVDAGVNPSFVLRLPGATANAASITFNSNITGRVLTLIARGIPGKTGAQAPTLTLSANR